MKQFSFTKLLPGVMASGVVAAIAIGAEALETAVFGRPWIDALVLAIIIGTLVHSLFGLDRRLVDGVAFSAKTVLEVAIVLLGASITFEVMADAGAWLLLMVAGIVVVALTSSYGISRGLGLSHRMATLVACGNSICGNSAIAAAAPVIGAQSDEVASSIAFTAALGVIVVLLLPVLQGTLGMGQGQYGVLAGLTVYAVPQVLAATLPVGLASTQIGTLIKLVRVLMLGPVILALSLVSGRRAARVGLGQMVPWFIVGFLVAMGINSAGLIPTSAQPLLHLVSGDLTIVAMAALGLSVNIRSVLASGGRVLAAGSLSIVALALVSLAAIFVLLPAMHFA